MIIPALIFVIFLCWGSFLNVVGHRLILGISLFGRSHCLHCQKTIAWYDLFPVLSYITLAGRCRACKQQISVLYPFIELLTAISMTALWYTIDQEYLIAHTIFFSALIVTIRSDLETMYISRWMTIALVPLGILFSFTDQLAIVPLNSILAAAIGFGGLWLIGTSFYLLTGKEGIGEGDYDLMALIGAFTGMIGIWFSLLIGSLLGSLIGLAYLKYRGQRARETKIPFGPFLAIAAIIYVLAQEPIMLLLMGVS